MLYAIDVMKMSKTVAILGATGFIGRRLVIELLCEVGYEVRVLTRDKQRDLKNGYFGRDVNVFEGNPADHNSLIEFLVPGCIVINLLYLWGAGEEANMACVNSLLVACKDRKISRLIHCSTADVVGRVSVDIVNEDSLCSPVGEYGTTKLKVEQAIKYYSKDSFDAVILRPTSVIGVGGEPLKKLAQSITEGARWKNYLKSCLFNYRSMNLTPLLNVVSAIIFIMRHTKYFEGEIYIISSDDDSLNNFRAVEQFFMDEFCVNNYILPRFSVPLSVLKLLLWLLRRSNINPSRRFDASKLRNLGFKSPVSLVEALSEYTEWYRRTVLNGKLKKINDTSCS